MNVNGNVALGSVLDRTVAQDQKRLMEIPDLEHLTVQTDEYKVAGNSVTLLK